MSAEASARLGLYMDRADEAEKGCRPCKKAAEHLDSRTGWLFQCFIRGSSASRRPSPIRLKPSTVSMMDKPGKMTVHGAF